MATTKDYKQLLDYLRTRRHLLNLSGIAEQSGISRSVLSNAMDGNTDGHGYPVKIPTKRLQDLYSTIKLLELKMDFNAKT